MSRTHETLQEQLMQVKLIQERLKHYPDPHDKDVLTHIGDSYAGSAPRSGNVPSRSSRSEQPLDFAASDSSHRRSLAEALGRRVSDTRKSSLRLTNHDDQHSKEDHITEFHSPRDRSKPSPRSTRRSHDHSPRDHSKVEQAKKEQKAATLIQAGWRGRKARKEHHHRQTRRAEEEARRSTSVPTTSLKKKLSLKDQQQRQERHKAATRLQKTFRGWRIRKEGDFWKHRRETERTVRLARRQHEVEKDKIRKRLERMEARGKLGEKTYTTALTRSRSKPEEGFITSGPTGYFTDEVWARRQGDLAMIDRKLQEMADKRVGSSARHVAQAEFAKWDSSTGSARIGRWRETHTGRPNGHSQPSRLLSMRDTGEPRSRAQISSFLGVADLNYFESRPSPLAPLEAYAKGGPRSDMFAPPPLTRSQGSERLRRELQAWEATDRGEMDHTQLPRYNVHSEESKGGHLSDLSRDRAITAPGLAEDHRTHSFPSHADSGRQEDAKIHCHLDREGKYHPQARAWETDDEASTRQELLNLKRGDIGVRHGDGAHNRSARALQTSAPRAWEASPFERDSAMTSAFNQDSAIATRQERGAGRSPTRFTDLPARPSSKGSAAKQISRSELRAELAQLAARHGQSYSTPR